MTDDLEMELKTKKICRFCLSQDISSLSNLYSRENRLKSSAPLPLQVMACVSIEVFTNDGMPSSVCAHCRMLMEFCYRFKQMCRKADIILRQFPLTGTWPEKINHPKIPEELLTPQSRKVLNTDIKTSRSPNEILRSFSEIQNQDCRKSPQPFSSRQSLQNNQPHKSQNLTQSPTKVKLLNKAPIKILNKEATSNWEPVLKQAVIKEAKDGRIELVTELVNTKVAEEIDPIKSAERVETNVFPCNHCDRSFPLRQLLDIHMVNHNRERNFKCEHCIKRFFTKYDLGKHALTHSNDKPYKCVICEKSFTRATLLHRHEKTHTDIPKFICLHCEKPFISKEELDKHTEKHNRNRPHQCKICDKSFAFKQGLERHEVVHAKEQPFPCQYCNRSFPTPSKLSRHLTAHAGDRPYPCKLCSKSYLLSHHLSRHLRSHRESSGTYKCYECQQTFTTRDNLIYHSALHATESLICPICKEQFEDIDSVTEHVKMHALGEQFACEFCDLIFTTQDKLYSHCTKDHADDFAIYNQLDKQNVEYTIEEEVEDNEILQEFIIEEFDDDNFQISADEDSGNIKGEITIEESNFENNGPNTNLPERRKLTKKKLSDETTLDRVYNSNNKINLNEFTEEESAIFEELLNEPSNKKSKIDLAKSQIELHLNKNSKQNKTIKMRKATLPTIITSVPKGITITKKEKESTDQIITVKSQRKVDIPLTALKNQILKKSLPTKSNQKQLKSVLSK